MAKTISVSLQKGGTGKTTTCEVVASIFGSKGKKVLLVDMDGQTNLTFITGVEVGDKTIIDLLTGNSTARDVICKCKYYDLITGDERLVNLESMEEVDVSLLKDILADVKDDYDYIFIDTPPALGNLLRVSLYASDYVLIPLDAKPLAVKGLDALEPTIAEVEGLQVLGVVLLRYNPRSVISKQLRDVLLDRAKEMNTVLFETTIRESVAVTEAQTVCQSLIDYAPKAKPTQDYYALADELLKRLEG